MRHDLDWLHILIQEVPLRCCKKTTPRQWEIEVYFRFIPLSGPSRIESIAVGFYEDPAVPFKHRRNSVIEHIKKSREFLHSVVLRSSSTGYLEDRQFKAIVPAGLEANPDCADFDAVFDLIDPTEDRPGIWVLRDKATDLMVQFKIPAGLKSAAIRELLKDAMLRMDVLKKSVGRTKAVAQTLGGPVRRTKIQ